MSQPQLIVQKTEAEAIRVIAIGASAGGLESLERFFSAIDSPLDCSFVVIQHLSPNYKTLVDQLLARRTFMPVTIAVSGQPLEPNHVYVMPPTQDMEVENGNLKLVERNTSELPHLPIDRFFASMAKSYGAGCAAIVLSGTGSDGSKGIREVRRHGGLILSESEMSARFTGMPRSAFATGCVDGVLPPESMGEFVRNFSRDRSETTDQLQSHMIDNLPRILELMQKECDIDFRHYKSSTVSRRIDRRMKLCGVEELSQYIFILENNPGEIRTLYQDMLIGVTRFFRDPPCFQALEQDVIPSILSHADDGSEIRVWSAGCASGEEAYSLSILFSDLIIASGRDLTYKIFATDVHPSSLQRASAGIYTQEALSNVSTERLERYFRSVPHGFAVEKSIRSSVLFAPHNVLQDPPFTDLDMVVCRNLLIYFDTMAQQKALSLFHFGLKKNGILMLGPSESVGELQGEFKTVRDRCKIFMKLRAGRIVGDIRLPMSLRPKHLYEPKSWTPSRRNEKLNRMVTYDRLLDTLMPPTLLVDSERQVVETFGGAQSLLRFPPRMVSNDLLSVCPPCLQTPLSVTFRRAQQDRQAARLPVSDVEVDGIEGKCTIDLLVTPLPPVPDEPDFYAVQITVVERGKEGAVYEQLRHEMAAQVLYAEDEKGLGRKLLDLESELNRTKESLQSTIEELETSNEELQSTNEELISSNEELQSTNEELSSVNEELHTVNIEYQNKNAQLRELNADMKHLLASTDIGTIFLDESLCIRRYTPRISGVFNLQPSDVGRKLKSFSHSLVDVDDLHEMTSDTLETGSTNEREVRDDKGNNYFLRIVPYTVEETVCGVIITLIDIATLVEARSLAERYQKRLQEVIDAIPIYVAYVNTSERYEYVNRQYTDWLQLKTHQIVGMSVRDVVGEKSYARIKRHIEGAFAGEPQHFAAELELGGKKMNLSVSYVPTRDANGIVTGFYVAGSNVTQLMLTERALAEAVSVAQKANQAKSDFLAKMSHEIRTPMTSIIGFADILDEQLRLPDNRDCVDVIRKNAYHLLELINEILDLSRIESGRMELEIKTFKLDDLLRECHNTILAKASANQVELELDLAPELNCYFSGDHRRLRQVVLNLLSNAVKFTHGGKVALVARKSKLQLVISVQDNGCGISEQDQLSLFEPFSQADNTDTRKYEGTGLGLAITKQLIDRMGGSIWVRSKLEEGSEFTFSVPWVDGLKEDSIETRVVALEDQIPRLDRIRILVIDDRRDIRFIAEHILSEAGADITLAENGFQGIIAVQRAEQSGEPFHCVVTDIQMPDMDGFETTRRLRDLGFNRPIVALTASAMAQERDQCIEAGCNAHMPKPINRARLVQTIANLLENSNSSDPS